MRRRKLSFARPEGTQHRYVIAALVLRGRDRSFEHQHAAGQREQEHELDRARDLIHDRLHLAQDLADVDDQHIGIFSDERSEPRRVAGVGAHARDIGLG